ncbi:MAG: transcriptional repressor [Planctomyces sp.]|jgi:Fur family ferric uptake transcriptional regulator|nr:transcriptional repressor [Planctomyces sp.]
MEVPVHLAAFDKDIDPTEKFREFLLTKGMRLTPEREAVVTAVYATHDHFDAEQWVSNLSQRGRKDGASRSTIYRTLSLLVEAGLLRRVARANDREVYEHDYGYPQHDHLICDKCGDMIEFANDAISEALEKVAMEHGFRMSGHRLEVEGVCAKCLRPPQRSHRRLDMI